MFILSLFHFVKRTVIFEFPLMDQQRFNFECQWGGKKVELPNLTPRDIKSIDEVKPSISTPPNFSDLYLLKVMVSAVSIITANHGASFPLEETEKRCVHDCVKCVLFV